MKVPPFVTVVGKSPMTIAFPSNEGLFMALGNLLAFVFMVTVAPFIWFFAGVVMHALHVMLIPSVFAAWAWKEVEDECGDLVSKWHEYAVIGMIFEDAPFLIINIVNTALSDHTSVVAEISLALSIVKFARIVWMYGYAAMVNGDWPRYGLMTAQDVAAEGASKAAAQAVVA